MKRAKIMLAIFLIVITGISTIVLIAYWPTLFLWLRVLAIAGFCITVFWFAALVKLVLPPDYVQTMIEMAYTKMKDAGNE